MKKLSFILIAVAALFAGTAQAQQYSTQTATLYSNLVARTVFAAASTNTVTSTAMLSHQQTIGVQANVALSASGTDVIVFKFATSVDGTTWNDNVYSISVTASGTNTVGASATFAVGGMGYVRLNSIENPAAAATVTPTIKWAIKKP